MILDKILKVIQSVNTKEKVHKSGAGSPRKEGTHGRLEIPELSISVPLYDANGCDSQKIVDAQDSAVLMRWGNQFAIADHNDQANFKNLSDAEPGKTTAMIRQGKNLQRYRCIKTQVGHITISENGNRIFDQDWKPVYQQAFGGLCIYTCLNKSAPNVMDIRLTYWQAYAE